MNNAIRIRERDDVATRGGDRIIEISREAGSPWGRGWQFEIAAAEAWDLVEALLFYLRR